MTLKEMRTAVELTQDDVARFLKVDQGTISKWEKGETRPCRKYHKKLARKYGVTVDVLLNACKK